MWPCRKSDPLKPTKTGDVRGALKAHTANSNSTKRGRRPDPIVEFPEPLWTEWDDPAEFAEALDLHMRRHGDSSYRLKKALCRPKDKIDLRTICAWREGVKVPQAAASLALLARAAQRYRLPSDYFRNKLPHQGRACTGHHLPDVSSAERRRLAWHLPDDFNNRSPAERAEILTWVRTVVISGATDYRRYQAAAIKQRYGLRFSSLTRPQAGLIARAQDAEVEDLGAEDPDLLAASVQAPRALDDEMAALVRFKTSTLTEIGFRRLGVWGAETADQQIEHLGLLFGALAASPAGAIHGRGVPFRQLSFALLALSVRSAPHRSASRRGCAPGRLGCWGRNGWDGDSAVLHPAG